MFPTRLWEAIKKQKPSLQAVYDVGKSTCMNFYLEDIKMTRVI